MRILQVMNAFHIGGVMRVVIDLSCYLRKSGHTVHVATVRSNVNELTVADMQRRELAESDVPTTVLGGAAFRRNAFILPFRLLKLIDEFKPDVVHCHDEQSWFVVSAARRIRRFRVARSLHGVEDWIGTPIAGFLSEQGFRNELLIAVSDDALLAHRELRRRLRLPVSIHSTVIYNGVRASKRSDQDIRLLKVSSRPRVAFFGRRSPEKGLDVLLEALTILGRRHPRIDAEFIIHTTGHQSNDLLGLVDRSVLDVQLHPPHPNAHEILADFDLIVMPSRHEGFGLLAVEAFANGTPVLASNVPGLRRVLPPQWPLTVPASDPQALAAKLDEYLLRRRDLQPNLSDIGRDWAQNFSIAAFGNRHIAAYENYLLISRHV
jgi:glycosyltransferase involved in cell wall biosynthesis